MTGLMARLSRFLRTVLARTGGFYLILAVALAQMGSNLTAIPILNLTRINAELTAEQLSQTSRIITMLSMLGNVMVWLFIFWLSRTAFARLNQWARGQPVSLDTPQEFNAWRQVTRMTRNYALVASATALFAVILPMLIYQYNALAFSQDQIIYAAIGGLLDILTIVTLDVLILDVLLAPAREVLLPREFSTQLAAAAGLRLPIRVQMVVLAMVLMGVLFIAPIGYHQTVTVLYEEIGSIQVLYDLQLQSVLAGAFALLVGAVLALLLSKSVSDPLHRLIDVFTKVEQGDLSQRAPVTAADEIGKLTVYFNRMISRLEELQQNLEQQVASRTAQLRATIEVGRAASAILDPDELISNVINLITSQFGHYYSAVFLLDPTGKWAELRDATGETGKVLKESRHRLEVGGKSMVGAAIATRRARIALDVGEEPVRFENPLLPYTRSEIALPLMVGQDVLGALDVQSTKEAAFSPQDIDTLQGLANQVAIALENARLFQETQQRYQELQAIQRQYLLESWSSLVRPEENLEYEVGGGRTSEEAAEIDIPLALRDQVIGEIRIEPEEEWTPEDRGWIEAVATQAALALENARLLEESQQMAARERLMAEITARVRASTNVDTILRTTIEELGRVLRVTEGMIWLEAAEGGHSPPAEE